MDHRGWLSTVGLIMMIVIVVAISLTVSLAVFL